MNKLKIVLSAFACIFAVTAAIAVNTSSTERKWYSRDHDTGAPMEQLEGTPTCVSLEGFCAAQYDVNEEGQIVAGPFTPLAGLIVP